MQPVVHPAGWGELCRPDEVRSSFVGEGAKGSGAVAEVSRLVVPGSDYGQNTGRP